MQRLIGRLSPRQVATAKPKRGRDISFLADGGNLLLQVRRSGKGVTKSWVFRFERDGKRFEMGLGPVHTRGLGQARAKACELREQLLDGINPLEAKRAAKREALAKKASLVLFKDAAQRYLKEHSDHWRSAEHRRQ